MSLAVVLETNTLGRLVSPGRHPEILSWFEQMREAGHIFILPEIADYELRRELTRIESKSLPCLDALALLDGVYYALLSTPVMRRAAMLGAEARRAGKPSADKHALDGDVILASTAQLFEADGRQVLVATDNVKHLERWVPAIRWWEIEP